MTPGGSPASALRQLIEQQRAARFEAFSGAAAQITLPLPERIINEVIRASVKAEVRLAVLPDNQIEVAFDGPWWLPFNSVRLRVHEDVEIVPSPTVRLRLISPAALAGRAAGAVATALGLLPSIVHFDGPEIRVDLGLLLRARGLGELVEFLAAARVQTAPGIMTLHLTLRVT